MKKCKRTLSLMLVVVMAISMMTGCGASKSSDTWKFGGIGPVTGGAAAYGQGVKNAIELAVNEINAAGGINGVQIEYRFEDDEMDNEKSVNAYNALKDWGMNVLIGCVTSGCCIAVSDKTATDNMFQLTPSASAVDCIKNDNVFQVCFTDPNQGIGSANYIGENAMAEKVAVIYNSSDVYSTGLYEKFMTEAANHSFEVVAEEAFTDDNKTDFSVQLKKAKEAGAELVFLPVYYQEASLILTQAAGMDYAPTFFGCDGLDGILTDVEGFDTSLAEGVILLTPFAADATDDATVKFVTAYNEKYGHTPNQFAADAYDAVYILKAAIEKSGATPADGVSGICEKLKIAMTEISYDGLTGEAMTWSATGEVNKAAKAMKIVNGSYKSIQ
ncbi:MAG TPA: ABC transporter substrate-binding protein [Lachnospiraceae bacterium]|nr:ABC transporter substrate-binding protein [Lachnospiraceae bacterium]